MGKVIDTAKGILGGGAEEAAQASAEQLRIGRKKSRRQRRLAIGDIGEFGGRAAEQLGQIGGAEQQLRAFSGAGGQEAQAQAFQQFQESPGQAFLRSQGERSLLRNQAAIGGLGGGNVQRALTQFGIGTAAQDFGNQFARLGSVAGLETQRSTNLANQLTGQGQQLVNVRTGAALQEQNLAQNLAGAASAEQLGKSAGLRNLAGVAVGAAGGAGLLPGITQIGGGGFGGAATGGLIGGGF